MGAAIKMLHVFLLLGIFGPCLSKVLFLDDSQELEADRRQALDHPRSPRQSRQAESRRQNYQAPRWELGYDPSDILSPPELLPSETRYRTVALHPRQPPPSVLDNSPVIWGTPKKGAVVSRPSRSSRGSVATTTVYYKTRESKKRQVEREEEEDDEQEDDEEGSSEEAGYTEEGHSYHQVPASIYSFFGTDDDGNFNWGRSPASTQQ